MLFQMEILNLVVAIIFVVYCKYANDVLKHVTCFIIIMLVSLVVLQYDQLNRISNEFQSFKILTEKQQVRHAEKFFRLTQKVQSEKAFTKRNQHLQDYLNKELISKILQNKEKLTDMESEIQSFKLFFEKKQQIQDGVNRRLNNKVLENEGKLTSTEKTFAQINKSIEILINESLHIYSGYSKMNKKVDIVVVDLGTVHNSRVELASHIKFLEDEIKSVSEYLQPFGYKLKKNKNEQNKENSNHYNHHHTTVEKHSLIPDLQGLVVEGVKRVISHVVSAAVNAVATIVRGIASWFAGFLW